MVCVPCLVVPALLWLFYKFVYPIISLFWTPAPGNDGTITGPPQGVEETNPHYMHIMEKINAHPLMLFTKSTCGFCQSAKTLLDKLQVQYEIEELDKRDDCDALQDMLQKLTGARSVPRIFIGGKSVGGSSELKALRNQEKLVPMLKEANASFADDTKKEN